MPIYTPLQPNEIRLFHLEPWSDSADDPVHLSLFVSQLHCPPRYEALSYVWGDCSSPIPVTINGENLEVGRSLYEALIELRAETPVRRALWVDAICINQRDAREKSQQVARMTEIYHKAFSTTMWVGRQESLIADLQNIEELHKALSNGYQEMEGWSLSLGNQVTRSMDTLLKMPYFSRSWITQEIVVSRNPVITFSTGKIGFDGIASTFRSVHTLQPGKSTKASEFVSLDNMRRAIQKIQETQHATRKVDGDPLEENGYPSHVGNKGPCILPGLTSLLISERDKGATDARDKIYALLGINGMAGCCQFSPDYTTTINELYIAVASQLIQQSDGLRILSSSQPRYSTRNLPSWVPDWSQPWRGGIDRRDVFTSGRSLAPRIRVNPDDNSLSLDGLRVDTVRRMTNVRFMDWEYTDIIDSVGSILEKEAGKLGVPRQSFCNNEPASLLLQVLVAGRGQFVMSKDLHHFKGFSNTGEFEMNAYNIHKRRWDRLQHNLAWVENEWDMFETSNGYVGLAPTSILPGDVVWILGGGNVPFILRQQTQGGYELIGECYLYGFMGDCVDPTKGPAERIIIW